MRKLLNEDEQFIAYILVEEFGYYQSQVARYCYNVSQSTISNYIIKFKLKYNTLLTEGRSFIESRLNDLINEIREAEKKIHYGNFIDYCIKNNLLYYSYMRVDNNFNNKPNLFEINNSNNKPYLFKVIS